MNIAMNATPAPWFRQFWPWFLIALPGSVVLASMATIYIAVQSNDGLVSENYYKEGLAIHRDVAARERAQALGVQANIRIDNNARRVIVHLSSQQPLPASPLQLELRHPTRADQDLVLPLQTAGNNTLYAELPRQLDYNWKIRLTSTAGHWQLHGRIDMQKSRDVVLPQ